MRYGSIESVCRLLFLLWLIWLPLPFGSVTAFSQLFLVLPPLVLLLVLFVVGRVGWKIRVGFLESRPYAVWTSAGLLFLALVAFQLAPLPKQAVESLSPAAWQVWSNAERVYELTAESGEAGGPGALGFASYRLTVDPVVTRIHVSRIAALLAAFQLGFLLFDSSGRRRLFAWILALGAVLQVLYAMRSWGSENQYGQHAVWGWKNELIFNRASGTFVNPNHFAAYVALILPLVLFLAFSLLRRGTRIEGGFGAKMGHFITHGLVLFTIAFAIVLVLASGILLSKSRAVLLAAVLATCLTFLLAASSAVVLRLRSNRKNRRKRLAAEVLALGAGVAVIALVFGFAVHRFGVESTISRLMQMRDEKGLVVGRTTGYEAAWNVWKEFPLFGSGLGTFEDVVLMVQPMEMQKVFNHAHNDYLELLATTGVIAFSLALAGVIAGALLLIRSLFRRERASSPSRRSHAQRSIRESRYLRIAALGSLAVVMLHALVDFDFFIPAIPATLAAILGVGVAALPSESKRPNHELQGEYGDELELDL